MTSGIVGVVGTAAVAPPLSLLERLAHVFDEPIWVDEGLLDGLQDETGRLASVSGRLAPDGLLKEALDHLNQLQRLQASAMMPDLRRRLNAVSADAAALVVWLLHVMDQPIEMAEYLALTKRLARQAEDPALQVQVLGLAGVMASMIPTGGQRGGPAKARESLDEACALASHAPGRVRVWLAGPQAVEYAADGKSGACWRAMEGGQHIPGGDGYDVDGGGFFGAFFRRNDSTLLTRMTGLCHILLKQPYAAEPILRRSLNDVRPGAVHHSITLLSDLTVVYVLQDEPEQASRCAKTAYPLAKGAGFTVDMQRTRGARDRFPKRWAPLGCVRELDEVMRAG
jgi:hypothetical protein